MVSKEKYYEYKANGLCVKCGKERGTSENVRCSECNLRFLENRAAKKNERLGAGVCIQCGVTSLLGNSKYCESCREKNNAYKKKLTDQPLSTFKENNNQCRLCNGPIDTLGIVCQKCLDQVVFTKYDALVRYGNQCLKCHTTEIEKLVIVSSDITTPMKHSGPDLYRYICFSGSPPKTYAVLCSACYWTLNMEYIKNIRDSLLSNEDGEDEIIIDADVINKDVDMESEDAVD